MVVGSEWNLVQGVEGNLEVLGEHTDTNGVTKQDVITVSQDGPIIYLLDGSTGGMESSFEGEMTFINTKFTGDSGVGGGFVFGSEGNGDYEGMTFEETNEVNADSEISFGASDVSGHQRTPFDITGEEGWQTIRVQVWFPNTEIMSVNLWQKKADGDDTYTQLLDRRNFTSPLSDVDDLTSVLDSGLGFKVNGNMYLSDVSLGH